MNFDYTTETITPESTGMITFAGTQGIEIPVGTTAQRPSLSLGTNGIETFLSGSLIGGSGYGNATYTAVPLTGGAGTGAQATIVVSGGAVTSVTITADGQNYVVGNSLSASN